MKLRLLLAAGFLLAGPVFAQTLRIPTSVNPEAPASGEVGFNPTTYQVAEDAGPVTLTVTRTDPSGVCDLFVNTTNGTASSGTDYVAVVSGTDIQYANDVGGNDTTDITITDRPGTAQGNLVFTVTLTKDNCTADTLVNAVATVTILDNDTGNDFPSGWTQPATLIDGSVRTINDSSVSYETATARFTIFHDGGQIFSTADHFKAPIFPIASLGDLTLTACVVSSHPLTAGSFPKAGVMVRETTNANSRYIFANILGVDGLQGHNLSRRAATAGTTTKTDFATPAVSLPWMVRLEIDGALDSWRAFYSESCSTPSFVQYDSGFETFLSTGDTVSVALAATVNDGGDVGWTGTAIFSDITVDTSTSVDHSATATANYLPTTYNVNEDAGTVTLRMTRAGGLSGALTIDFDTADGTCVAGTHYTTTSGSFTWVDGIGGEDTATVAVTDIAGIQGAASCTFTTDSTVSTGSATISNGIATITWIDTDQMPPQAGSWSLQDASSCSDGIGSFDAFIPGMRGHGSCNRGGFVLNTTVHVVDTIAELQTAAGASCPKVILFGTGGLYDTGGSSITMNRCTNWSIVGASAPGGVTITGSVNASIEVRGSEWTIDHLTIAPGDTQITPGNTGNRRAIQYSFGLEKPDDKGILLNNNLIWGADETVTCYTKVGSEQTNMLVWQNVIAMPVGQHLLHIIQDTCQNYASIRNTYIHSDGRHPLVRADGYFHANNFTANPGFQSVLATPCGGAFGPLATTRQNYINNFMVRGPDSGSHSYIRAQDATCTTFEVHESGNAVMQDDNSILNCANNACTDGFTGDDLKSSIISAIFPTGYVPEVITTTSQGLIDFATQITTFSGERPKSRLAYIGTVVGEAINMVDGVGSEGAHSVDTDGEGGISSITPASSAPYDPTDIADNGFANMPTGATANTIQTSGLTKLHEWVICAFYDSIMPSGYRESGLEDCTAP